MILIRVAGKTDLGLRVTSLNNTILRLKTVWPLGSADTVRPCLPLTLTFDRLTLNLVCELEGRFPNLRWGTFLQNVGTLGLWVLELFAI